MFYLSRSTSHAFHFMLYLSCSPFHALSFMFHLSYNPLLLRNHVMQRHHFSSYIFAIKLSIYCVMRDIEYLSEPTVPVPPSDYVQPSAHLTVTPSDFVPPSDCIKSLEYFTIRLFRCQFVPQLDYSTVSLY